MLKLSNVSGCNFALPGGWVGGSCREKIATFHIKKADMDGKTREMDPETHKSKSDTRRLLSLDCLNLASVWCVSAWGRLTKD